MSPAPLSFHRAAMRFRWLRRTPLAAAGLSLMLASAWSCRELATVPIVRGARDAAPVDPHFLRLGATAPFYATLSGSFYAKRTEDRGVTIYFHATPGAKDSTKFLDFQVPAGALATAPDGTPYTDADSVLINVTVTDPQRMIVTFEPSGLKFSQSTPAQMTLSFLRADDDVNGDGLIDSADASLKTQLHIWGQETPGGVWTRMPSALFLDVEELVVGIPGFSGYAAAY